MSSSFLQSRNKPLLAAIDAAVAQYHSAATGSKTAALHAISDAVTAWFEDKEARGVGSGRTQAMIQLRAAAELELRSLGQAPGMQYQVVAGAAQQAAAAALRFESHSVSASVKQTITYPPGSARNVWNPSTNAFVLQTVTVPTKVDFPWNVKLTMQLYGTTLLVKVKCNPQPKNASVVMPASTLSEWNTHIQSAWNIATLIDGNRQYAVQFEIDWVNDADAYEINVDNPPPIPASLLRAARGSSASAKAKRDQVAELQKTNTIDMANWAWSDRQAIIHEFGHMIGCPDEYSLTACVGFGQVFDAGVHGQPAFSTDSIMNDTSNKGRIHERHFLFLQKQYRLWRLGSRNPDSRSCARYTARSHAVPGVA